MIDVVIVAYRSDDTLPACLDGVRRLSGLGQVIVVDNGGGASTAEQAATAGATVVVRHDNPGFGASQNAGVALTAAPYVLLLNPDAVPIASAIATGVNVLDGEDDVAALQGGVVNPEEGLADRSGGDAIGAHHLIGRALGGRRLLGSRAGRALAGRIPSLRDHAERVSAARRDVEALAATALLVRRSAFEEVGGFDPRYFLYGEDADLCRRWRAAGWRLVALPGEWATHVHGSSSVDDFDRELHWWRGVMRYAAQWWPRQAFALGVGAAALMAVRLAARRPRRARDAWDALVSSALAERRRHLQPWSRA